MTDDILARKAAELGHTIGPDAARRIAIQQEAQAGSAEEIDRAIRDLSDGRLEELAEDYPAALKPWPSLTMEERRAMRARNELARRRRVNEQQQAQVAEVEARQRAAADAAQADARRVLRANFAGTDAEFAERWPQLWARFRDRQALDGAAAGYDAVLARKRAEIGL